ncbi:hypothetical protein C9J89_02375 [Klebsiella pneumoniae]|nr:hypothetical protein C9J89_02375 [Klebsiella pneumoniae]
MGSCAAPSAKGDDKFITTDYLQQCLSTCRRLKRQAKKHGPTAFCYRANQYHSCGKRALTTSAKYSAPVSNISSLKS